MAKIYLLLGTNQGNREALLQQAREALNGVIGPILARSPIYETEPWGFLSEQWFLNQALCLDTASDPLQALDLCLNIEQQLGRQRLNDGQYHSRTMDIDIIAYQETVFQNHRLTVPHPRMCERRFVLQPLADIAPRWCHPQFHLTAAQLLENCPDTTQIHPL